MGLRAGDRIVLNLPNIPAQRFWTEGAKSLDRIYTPVFGGFSETTLSDRIHDDGARIVIMADSGYRNAQIVPFKSAYTDPALDNFVPVAAAHAVVAQRLSSNGTDAAVATAVLAAIDDALAGEVTVLCGDVMRGVGRALADVSKRRARRIRRCRACARHRPKRWWPRPRAWKPWSSSVTRRSPIWSGELSATAGATR